MLMIAFSINLPQGSLKVHPDRVAEDEREICTKKFQVRKGFSESMCCWYYIANTHSCNNSALQCLSAVYTVLSDESRRGLYDETGEVIITKKIISKDFF